MDKSKLILLFLVSILVSISSLAHDYEGEYSIGNENVETHSLLLDGIPYTIFDYDGVKIIFDDIDNAPLYYKEDQENMVEIFRQEFFYNEFKDMDNLYFQKILVENLELNPSAVCTLIDYDKILGDELLKISESEAIKRFIPKKCLGEGVNCKEIAKLVKDNINKALKVQDYMTPEVVMAVYCVGESNIAIKSIFAPSREMDAIILNIQKRAYFIGQIDSLYGSKSEMISQLDYSIKKPLDLMKDIYYGLRQLTSNAEKGIIQLLNLGGKAINSAVSLFGKEPVIKEISEPTTFSQRLEMTKNDINRVLSDSIYRDSKEYSSKEYEKSWKRVYQKYLRNNNTKNTLKEELQSVFFDWKLPAYLNLIIYDYNTSYTKYTKNITIILDYAQELDKVYKYNSAYESYLYAESILEKAKEGRDLSLSTRKVSKIKIVIYIALISLIIIYFRKKNSY